VEAGGSRAPRLDNREEREKILREACERSLGVPWDAFAYPHGQPVISMSRADIYSPDSGSAAAPSPPSDSTRQMLVLTLFTESA
jgi:hypothetical protein